MLCRSSVFCIACRHTREQKAMSEETLEDDISRKNMQQAKNAYAFFSQAAATRSPFTLEDICKASGYSKKTAHGYRQKKWYWFIREDGEYYYCEGFHRCPKWYYDFMLRQKELPLEEFIDFVCQEANLRRASSDEPLKQSPQIKEKKRRNQLLEWLLFPVAIVWWLWSQVTGKQHNATHNKNTLKDGTI